MYRTVITPCTGSIQRSCGLKRVISRSVLQLPVYQQTDFKAATAVYNRLNLTQYIFKDAAARIAATPPPPP